MNYVMMLTSVLVLSGCAVGTKVDNYPTDESVEVDAAIPVTNNRVSYQESNVDSGTNQTENVDASTPAVDAESPVDSGSPKVARDCGATDSDSSTTIEDAGVDATPDVYICDTVTVCSYGYLWSCTCLGKCSEVFYNNLPIKC